MLLAEGPFHWESIGLGALILSVVAFFLLRYINSVDNQYKELKNDVGEIKKECKEIDKKLNDINMKTYEEIAALREKLASLRHFK